MEIELELPELAPQTPYTVRQVQHQMNNIAPKILNLLSSPSTRKFQSLTRGTTQVLDETELYKIERDMLYRRVKEASRKALYSRKRL